MCPTGARDAGRSETAAAGRWVKSQENEGALLHCLFWNGRRKQTEFDSRCGSAKLETSQRGKRRKAENEPRRVFQKESDRKSRFDRNKRPAKLEESQRGKRRKAENICESVS